MNKNDLPRVAGVLNRAILPLSIVLRYLQLIDYIEAEH